MKHCTLPEKIDQKGMSEWLYVVSWARTIDGICIDVVCFGHGPAEPSTSVDANAVPRRTRQMLRVTICCTIDDVDRTTCCAKRSTNGKICSNWTKKIDQRSFSHENRLLWIATLDWKVNVDSWGFFSTKKLPTGKSIPVQVAQSGQRDAETRPSALPRDAKVRLDGTVVLPKMISGLGKHWKSKAMTETSPQNVTKVNSRTSWCFSITHNRYIPCLIQYSFVSSIHYEKLMGEWAKGHGTRPEYWFVNILWSFWCHCWYLHEWVSVHCSFTQFSELRNP